MLIKNLLVAIPKVSYPFPSRTRKSSPSGTMIVKRRLFAKVVRCQLFLFILHIILFFPLTLLGNRLTYLTWAFLLRGIMNK